MNRFFITPNEFNKDLITLEKEDHKHLSKVLRLQIDDIVEIYDGNLNKALAKIINIDSTKTELKILERTKVESENKNIIVDLFQGIPKKDKLELISQKTTELGINSIIPFYSKRSIPKPSSKDKKKAERLQKIVFEACKQSGRGLIPKVQEFINFKEILSLLPNYDLILVAYESEEDLTLKSFLNSYNLKDTPLKIAIFIGPEGGFDKSEIELLKDNGANIVSLGKRILRTETAGLSLLSQLNYHFED